MLSTAIVIFREAFEIALIVGIVLVATRGLPARGKWIALGMAAGIAGAGLVAAFAEAIQNAADGMGQELFNAGVLLVAAGFIGWTVVWMSTHARAMVANIKQTGKDVIAGTTPCYMLSVIIGLAMLREGAEIVLFVYGMLSSGQEIAAIIEGLLLGAAAGTLVGVAIYFGLINIPTKYIFRVTGWLLILLVAGLVSQAFGYLLQAGYFESFSTVVWDSSAIISEESIIGKLLHGLAGYTAQPAQIQVMVYVLALAIMAGTITLISRKQAAR